MKYIFFGTPEFAAIVLQKLIEADFLPLLVVCNPDRPVGRKKTITPPPVKVSAQKHGIRVLQPENLLDSKFQILDSHPDFAIVAAYAKIIPQEILNLFPGGVIGVHPSLLPKYRGPSPIQSAILGGEKESGVTIYLLDEKMDHGPVLAQYAYRVTRDENYTALTKKLAELGGRLLVETLPKFLAGGIKPQAQDETAATYTKKFSAGGGSYSGGKTEDAFVEPDDLEKALSGETKTSELIDRKIRALNPEPGVWTTQDGKRLKLLEAIIKDGGLILKKIQQEGKKPRIVS